jgi:hypothetical protein
LARLKRPDLVALEAVQVPAPINALPHMGEIAARTMLNAELAHVFLSQRQQQVLLSPSLHPDVPQTKLHVRVQWVEDAVTMD